MLQIEICTDSNGERYIKTPIFGKPLLTISQLNKGTAFTQEERIAFDLIGKLPLRIETLEEQLQRAYAQYQIYDCNLNKNIYLNQLLNENQVLFYKLLAEHIEEMFPTVYTPIVGNAVESFHKRFRQPRGLYIAYPDRDRIPEILKNRSNADIHLIVASDGEGVLGIGDQGIGAMAIPVAKLMVYTAIGGINPANTLPIMLDAGTNNRQLLDDPMYLGWRHPRLSGNEYDEFIGAFVQAVKAEFPQVFLHWEDFGRHNAYRHLTQYRNTLCSFNDDIQGTGVVALGAVLAAVTQVKSTLAQQRIVIFGAGTAGMGIADTLLDAFIRAGLSESEARSKFWLIDRFGLLTTNTPDLTEAQAAYARDPQELKGWPLQGHTAQLLDVVQQIQPTLLIGCSAQCGAFTEPVIKAMAQQVEHPIILPLSNPPQKCEANPEDVFHWTEGQALIATGSPFPDIVYQDQVHPISQCNNYLAFPGIGLGISAVKATRVTDDMLYAASQALAKYAVSTGKLLPSIKEAKAASRAIAIAVAQSAIDAGLATISTDTTIETIIDQAMWEPKYLPYKRIVDN